MKITSQQVHQAYTIARQVYEAEISKDHGLWKLTSEEGLNLATAAFFIDDLRHLLTGTVFKRTLSSPAMDYFLAKISQDYGPSGLETALSALKQHITYHEKEYESVMKSMRQVYQRYESKLSTIPRTDEEEQEEIASNLLAQNLSKSQLLSELLRITDKEPEQVTIQHRAYKRDNHIIAKIKVLRDFNCQLCGLSIHKKDGSRYIEAAHIQPKRQQGRETLKNIILLCPNHHKEFDLGDRQILNITSDGFDLLLNHQAYYVTFIPDLVVNTSPVIA
ncbi:HNH endonuclease [Hymenobacter tenuis]